MSNRFYGFALLACCSALALSMSSPSTATPVAQDKGVMSEEFIDNLKDFNKAIEKMVIEVGNIATLKDKMRKAKPIPATADVKEEKHLIEKINDNIEEMKRTMKNLDGVAKSGDEKTVTKAANWTAQWVVRYASMTIRAQFDYNTRWAAFYEKLLGVMVADMKKSTREKKYSQLVSGVTSKPASVGQMKTGQLSDQKYHHSPALPVRSFSL